jgi:hypothetical protein
MCNHLKFMKFNDFDLSGNELATSLLSLHGWSNISNNTFSVADRVVALVIDNFKPGDAICLKLLQAKPYCLVLIDFDGGNIEHCYHQIRLGSDLGQSKIVPLKVDINDSQRIQDVFQKYCPETIFYQLAGKTENINKFTNEEVYKDDVFKIKQLFRYGSLSGLKDVTILS